MLVKIGDKIYDSQDEPIMVVLSSEDKHRITNMGQQTKYCCYPEGFSINEIIAFMGEEIVGTHMIN